ncbi:MAG: histidine kinase [Marinoscillum sp.]
MEEPHEIELLSIVLPLIGIIFLIAVVVLYLNQYFQRQLTQQKLAEQELINKQQQALLQTSINAQESERKRIARDLHDELGATLSISRMHLMKLEQNQEISKDLKISIENVRSVIESSLTSMRRISHELMPAQLETFGLAKTLHTVVNRVNETGGLSLSLEQSLGNMRMPWELEVGIYRIVMELVHNTIKHGRAAQAHISLKRMLHQLEMIYTDDGVGMKTNVGTAGLGLKSIEARANAIGGTFQIFEGRGFHARVVLSINI